MPADSGSMFPELGSKAFSDLHQRVAVLHLIPKHGVGAEIGVFKGEYSEKILSICEPRHLHLVDPWVNSHEPDHQQSNYGNNGRNDMQSLFESVAGQFGFESPHKDRVTIHRCSSKVFAKSLASEYLDFVYIDGDHNYDAVKGDLDTLFPKVKPGGLICIDDYMDGYWWGDGVIRACHEFIAANPVRIVFAMQHQIALRKV